MDKQALIRYTQKLVSSTDGTYFLVSPEHFLRLMLMEDCVSLELIKPHQSAKIDNLKWWKERLIIMTENRCKLHNNMKVILMKDSDRKGNLDGFLFDGFLFNDISLSDADRIRSLLNEKGRGLFKSNQELMERKTTAVVKPFYVRLVELKNTDVDRGILILRNFY